MPIRKNGKAIADLVGWVSYLNPTRITLCPPLLKAFVGAIAVLTLTIVSDAWMQIFWTVSFVFAAIAIGATQQLKIHFE